MPTRLNKFKFNKELDINICSFWYLVSSSLVFLGDIFACMHVCSLSILSLTLIMDKAVDSCDLFLWDVKEPTPLFEKIKVRRPWWCSQPLPRLDGLSVRTHLNWSLALLRVPHHMVEVMK